MNSVTVDPTNMVVRGALYVGVKMVTQRKKKECKGAHRDEILRIAQ